MSQENLEVVRQAIVVADRSRRRLEERFALRFPHALALLSEATWRLWLLLPTRSRLRQAIVRRYMKLGVEAVNRRDLEAAFVLYHPGVESIMDERLVALGFELVYRGREARIEAQRRWIVEWGEERTEVEELIDLGDGRLLLLVRNRARAPAAEPPSTGRTPFSSRSPLGG